MPRTTRHTRPTMKDVAQRAGVSRALVSIVMRGQPGASPTNRERVMQAAQELGYTLDVNARRLRESTSRVLGVTFEGHDPFTARLLDAAHTAAVERGLDVVLTMTGQSVPLSKALSTLHDSRCLATLVISSITPDIGVLPLLDSTPTAFVGAYCPPGLEGRVSAAHTDDAAGITLMVDHLYTLGHRDVAVMRVTGRTSGDIRANTAIERAHALGMQIREFLVDGYEEAHGVAAGLEFVALDKASQPTAVMCANDSLALGMMHVLSQAGIHVPHDVSLTGFDDAGSGPWPTAASLGLTTVRQNVDAITASAMDSILRVARSSDDHTQSVLTPELIVRSSSAAPSH
ncbi:LacI family DNA-binding transcriptional regulator [Actinomyces vulturis]|uniref:LacI family DNA-binding transcriptional regulator n=1 Tax=Actinomyces vulturis TaxID=1857645 RepID=UPI0008333672|nr:LacI family DNA-binding transcriptional regulator [Actinomyces vulturis]